MAGRPVCNIPDWLTFMYASAKIGVVMVTVNPVYKSHELDYVLKQSDMKALCVIDAYRDVDYLQIIRDLVMASSIPTTGEPHLHAPEKHRGLQRTRASAAPASTSPTAPGPVRQQRWMKYTSGKTA